jgi:ribosomal protein S18 acetylase RimI-like enzyme
MSSLTIEVSSPEFAVSLIRPLEVSDCEEFVALRRASLHEAPLAFASSTEDDRAGNVEAVRDYIQSRESGLILGAFETELVGCVGLRRGQSASTRHQIHLWGMYVAPEVRSRGLGRALMVEALARAKQFPGVSWAYLDVTSAAPIARRLYESLGFRHWGTQPAGFQKRGQLLEVHHFALPLGEQANL